MSSDQQFCLRWHNYQSSLLASLPQLLDGDDLTDVTLSAGGRNLRAHRMVLSTCSQYFKELFKVLQPLQHPVIVLPGADFTDLCALVTFMYSGEVNIYQEQLPGLLSMADTLQIRGLAEVNGSTGKSSDNEAIPSSKKCPLNLGGKPPKLPPHASIGGTTLTSQSPVVDAKPPQVETVDIREHYIKGKIAEYEVCTNRPSKQARIDNELHYGNVHKESDCKLSNVSDNFDLLVESIPSKKLELNNSKSEPQHGTCRTNPMMALSAAVDNTSAGGTRMKTEECCRDEGTGMSRISSDLSASVKKSTWVENMEMGNVENPVVQASQRSPSSEDSGGGNFGPEAATSNRIHLSPGLQFSSLKLISSPSANNRFSPGTKLFATCLVCGKQLSNQYNLRVHMETHQNVNYACGVCSHISRSRDALRKHVSYRHPGEGREKATPIIPKERKLGAEGKIKISGTNLVESKSQGLSGNNDVDTHLSGGLERVGNNRISGIEILGEEVISNKTLSEEGSKLP